MRTCLWHELQPTALCSQHQQHTNSCVLLFALWCSLLPDFHVVTLSSQIGRLAYELAQVGGSNDAAVPDRSLDYHSLDSLW